MACKMKSVTNVEKITASELKVRKSLHELQPSAIDKATLVGADRIIKSIPQSKEEKPKKDILKTKKSTSICKKDTSICKKVITKDQAIQTAETVPEEDIEITIKDLTSTACPSENYWQVIAERRRIALKKTLEENKEMIKYLEKAEEEKRIYEEMLNESRTLVELLQDMIGDDRSDIHNSLEDSVL